MAEKGLAGLLRIGMTVSTQGFKTGLAAASKSVGAFSAGLKGATGAAISGLGKIGLAAMGLRAVMSTLEQTVGIPLRLAANIESLSISFKVLLGSASQASKLLVDLRKFAADTPLGLEEVAQASKQLLAYGFSVNELLPTLRRLGDLSSALSQPLSEIAYVFGTTRTQTHVMGKDIMQFMMRGIDIVGALSVVMRKNKDEVSELVSAGKVGFPEMQKALVLMTSNGGKFSGMLAEQGQSLNGLWSQMRDKVSEVMTEIGVGIADVFSLRDAMKGLTAFLDRGIPTIKSFFKNLKDGIAFAMPAWKQAYVVISDVFSKLSWGWRVLTSVFNWGWRLISAGLSALGITFTDLRDTAVDVMISTEFYLKNWRKVFTQSTQATMDQLQRFRRERKKALFDEDEKPKSKDRKLMPPIPARPKLPEEVASKQKEAKDNAKSDMQKFNERMRELNFLLNKNLITPQEYIANRWQALPDKIKTAVEDSQTPLQKFNAEAQDLFRFRLDGFIDDRQLQMSLNKLRSDLMPWIEERNKALNEEAKGVKESVQTDFQRFQMEAAKLRFLFANKKLTQDEFRKAMQNALPDKVKDIIEETKTPLVRFQEQLKELQQYRLANLISPEQFQKAAAILKKDILDPSKETQFAGAARFGSQEAAKAINRHQFGNSDSAANRLQRVNQQQLATQQRMATSLDRMDRKSGNTKVVTMPTR